MDVPPTTPPPHEPGGPEGHRRGRVPRAVREAQIDAIASELFGERGYEGTSMEEISRRIGLSRPVVYDLAGGSKAALFRRVLHHHLDQITADVTRAMRSSDDPARTLHAALVAFFRFGDEHRREFELIVSGSGDPELDRTLRDLQARSNQYLLTAFGAIADARGAPLDARRLAALPHAVQGVADYVGRWRLDDAPDLPAEDAADLVCDILVPGLTAMLGPAGPGHSP